METRVAAEPADVLDRVRRLIGKQGAGLGEGVVVSNPASAEEAADLLRLAGERGWKVLPLGTGLAREFRPSWRQSDRGSERGWGEERRAGTAGGGHPSRTPDLVISTSRLRGPIEHDPADLVVRAPAGLRLGEVSERVSEEGQWLALDPPGGSAPTLGGVVATGVAGPLGVQYGRPRDQLLGLTLVDGAGRILSLGGRVVKNVAGFDLVRLAAGSWGRLGVVTEATFRLYPIPEEDRTLVWAREELRDAWELGRLLATLPLPVASAELIGGRWPEPLNDPGCRVSIRLTGSASSVKAMRDVLIEQAGHPLRELGPGASRLAARVLSEGDGEGPFAFRLDGLPDRIGSLLGPVSGLPLKKLAVHLLHGGLRGSIEPADESDPLAALAGPAREAQVSIRILRAPRGGGDTAGTYASAASPVDRLRERLTQGFDPAGVLPGAWMGG